MQSNQFAVKYKFNSSYAGTWQLERLIDQNNPDHIGIHGVFTGIATAKAEMAKVLKYFQQEEILGEKLNAKGKAEIVVEKTNIHDNVLVWVEDSKGTMVEVSWDEDEPEEKDAKGKKKKELQPA